MKTVRWLVTLFLAMSLIFTFCACDKDDKKEETAEEEEAVLNRIDTWEIDDISCRVDDDNHVYVSFTCANQGGEASAFAYDVTVSVYQDGVELRAQGLGGATDYDALEKIKPGVRIMYQYGYYYLRNETSDIEVEFTHPYSESKGKITRTFDIENCRVEKK